MSEFRVRPRPAPYAGMVRRSSAVALLGAVLAGLAGLLPALALISRDAWLEAWKPGPADLSTLVVALTGPIAMGLAAWLLIAVLLSAADVLVTGYGAPWAPRPGRSSNTGAERGRSSSSGFSGWRPEGPARAGLTSRCARRVAPAVLRHGVAALIGVTLLSAPATAATSDPGHGRHPAIIQVEPAASPGAFSAAWPPVRAEVLAAAQDRFTVVPGYVTAEITPDDALADAPAGAVAGTRTRIGASGVSTSGTEDVGGVRGWLPAPPADRGDVSVHIARAGTDLDAVAATGRRRRLDDDRMVVRRGDTLWSIAARSLGPGATEAQIAGEWPHWFTANRDVIGPDPDHLLPGQQLRPPMPGARSHSAKPSSAGDQR